MGGRRCFAFLFSYRHEVEVSSLHGVAPVLDQPSSRQSVANATELWHCWGGCRRLAAVFLMFRRRRRWIAPSCEAAEGPAGLCAKAPGALEPLRPHGLCDRCECVGRVWPVRRGAEPVRGLLGTPLAPAPCCGTVRDGAAARPTPDRPTVPAGGVCSVISGDRGAGMARAVRGESVAHARACVRAHAWRHWVPAAEPRRGERGRLQLVASSRSAPFFPPPGARGSLSTAPACGGRGCGGRIGFDVPGVGCTERRV